MLQGAAEASRLVLVGLGAAMVVWNWARTRRPTRRLLVLAAPEEPGEAYSTALRSNANFLRAVHGACLNAAADLSLAGPFTHAVLLSFSSPAERAYATKLEAYKPELRVNKAAIGGGALELDYNPTVVLQPAAGSLPASPLRHVLFARFKPGAPVDELIAGYTGLPAQIQEMRGFEWGRLQVAAEGYEYVFMTTFCDVADRDAYLAHPAHDKFAAWMFEWMDKLIVADFVGERTTLIK